MEPANIRQQSSHLTPSSSSSSAAAAETRSSEKKLLLESQANENSALIHEKNGEINLAIASNLVSHEAISPIPLSKALYFIIFYCMFDLKCRKRCLI
jgi:hypothetical protein